MPSPPKPNPPPPPPPTPGENRRKIEIEAFPHCTTPHENQSPPRTPRPRPPPETAPRPQPSTAPQTHPPGQSRQPWGPSHSLNLKLEPLSCGKPLNFALLDNYFTAPSIEVQIRHRKTLKLGPGRFLERYCKFQRKYDSFLTIGAVNKNIKSKRKFCRKS